LVSNRFCHSAFGRHLYVGGFQIAVDDSFATRCIQRFGDLPCVIERRMGLVADQFA
jgi:hypothetical protein